MPGARSSEGTILAGSLAPSGSAVTVEGVPQFAPSAAGPQLFLTLTIGTLSYIRIIPQILGPDGSTWFNVYDGKQTQLYTQFTANYTGSFYITSRTTGLPAGRRVGFVGPSWWRINAYSPDTSTVSPGSVSCDLVAMDQTQIGAF